MNKKDCICGNENVHSIECKNYKRKQQFLSANKKRRIKLIKEHKCDVCGKKVKPIRCPHCKGILKYTRRCKECLKKCRS